MALKEKGDRLKESITLLKKIADLPAEMGMNHSDNAYIQIRSAISEWTKTGVPCTLRIPMYRQGRIAELSLPSDGGTATLALKVLPAVSTVEDMD
jgi:hypothetical protein